MKINKLRLAIAILILAAAILGFMNYQGKLTAKIIEEQNQQEYYDEWLPENCSCLEKERIKCSNGFELIENVCKNEKAGTFTNVLKACSKYSCEAEGTNYTFNQENKKWEIEQ